MGEVAKIGNDFRKSMQEKDFHLSSNAVKRVKLKESKIEVEMLLSGNQAVSKEIVRLDEESKSLVKSHAG